MTAGHIDYEALVHEALRAAEQEALRGVVRSVLQQVARSGLTHDHHFYIAFNTQHPGVHLSKRLKEKYPLEMTIVLQHRFWDLEVGEDRFEVKLTFDGIPERLGIPLKSVKVFYDPSVPYGLQFEESELTTDARRSGRAGGAERAEGQAAKPGKPRVVGNEAPIAAERANERMQSKRSQSERTDASGADESQPPVPAPAVASVPQPAAEKASPVAPVAAPDRTPPAKPSARPVLAEVKADPADPPAPPPDTGKVVDFSKFRKK